MLSLTYFYSQTDFNFIEEKEKISKHCSEYGLVFVDICIDDNPEIQEKYRSKTPVVVVGPYVLNSPFTDTDLKISSRSALDRHTRFVEEGNQEVKNKIRNGLVITNLDRLSYFISKSYVWIISIFMTLFIAIPFLAPILEKNGNHGAANVIYKVYHVLCHQLAFRSFFLFGEQDFYPRELASIEGVQTYEDITGSDVIDLDYARFFVGDSDLGYKIAFCQRDLAIYGSLAIFGFLFQVTGKKFKQLRWFYWILIALMPIAIDGFSQIPSLSTGWPTWVPIRESTPFIRVLTGTLFGVGTGWFMFPMMEESMKETRIMFQRKFAIIKKLKKQQDSIFHETN